jgi:hypothetical protein
VNVEQVGPDLADDPGNGAIIERKIIPVAAIKPFAPTFQGEAKIIHPVPGFPPGKLRIGNPDDHRAPA